MTHLGYFTRHLSPWFLGLFLSACTLTPYSPTNTVVTTCNISSDQTGTISGHWLTTPVPIALAQGNFTPDESAAIVAAADTWNQFFSASKGTQTTIDYGGSSSSPKTSTAANGAQTSALCGQGILQGNQFSGSVVIY